MALGHHCFSSPPTLASAIPAVVMYFPTKQFQKSVRFFYGLSVLPTVPTRARNGHQPSPYRESLGIMRGAPSHQLNELWQPVRAFGGDWLLHVTIVYPDIACTPVFVVKSSIIPIFSRPLHCASSHNYQYVSVYRYHLHTMQAEIEAYEYQLSQVTLALDADPSNSELVSLKGELEELITLTRMAGGSATAATVPAPAASTKDKGKGKEAASATPAPNPTPSFLSSAVASGSGSPSAVTRKFNAGDECTAKYKDGKWCVFSSSV